jgi:hypothetical protein
MIRKGCAPHHLRGSEKLPAHLRPRIRAELLDELGIGPSLREYANFTPCRGWSNVPSACGNPSHEVSNGRIRLADLIRLRLFKGQFPIVLSIILFLQLSTLKKKLSGSPFEIPSPTGI